MTTRHCLHPSQQPSRACKDGGYIMSKSLTVVLAELEGRSVFSTTFRSDYQQEWVYYTLLTNPTGDGGFYGGLSVVQSFKYSFFEELIIRSLSRSREFTV